MLNDGQGKVEDNDARWVYRQPLPHTVQFHWDEPQRIGAARIVSGYHVGGAVTAPITEFKLQWHDERGWHDTGVDVSANQNPAWTATFAPVRTDMMRLIITETKDQISRVWEIEFYPPVDGG